MVIIFSKTLEKKKGVNDVSSKDSERLLQCELHMMSRGTTLLSCGTVEADRWFDLAPACSIQRAPPCQSSASLENLWAVLPEQYRRGHQNWAWDVGKATAITSLIRDLSLGNSDHGRPHATAATSLAPAAPPSKRQCRSLSLSDEYGSFQSPWRPQGSRIWQPVEKRRCHSGGSVRGAGAGGQLPFVQRSSSFSLPSHASGLADGALELSCFTQMPFRPLFTASPSSSEPSSSNQHHFLPQQHPLKPLSLSHEHIGLPELQREEEEEEEDDDEEEEDGSSPDSTPELGRRCGARCGATGDLSQSSSQPCVLSHKKVGMKRRRPEDAQEKRPSLNLAKMTQKLQSCQRLRCPGIPAANCYQSSSTPSSKSAISQSDSELNLSSSSDPRLGSWQEMTPDDDGVDADEEDSSCEELDSDSECIVGSSLLRPSAAVVAAKHTLWKGDRGVQTDTFQLGEELDLDQIERN